MCPSPCPRRRLSGVWQRVASLVLRVWRGSATWQLVCMAMVSTSGSDDNDNGCYVSTTIDKRYHARSMMCPCSSDGVGPVGQAFWLCVVLHHTACLELPRRVSDGSAAAAAAAAAARNVCPHESTS
jgi:hypothetical protein